MEAFGLVLRTFERLGIEYLVGGSLASSIHGVYRASADVDLVAALYAAHAPLLEAGLGREFYAGAAMIADALGAGRAFNLLHHASGAKFDVFPFRTGDAFMESQFARREFVEQAGLRFAVASAEDTVLAKLVRFRSGGEVSQRQRHDVRGVLTVRAGLLNVDYLRAWVPRLGVAGLLESALAEAAGGN